MTATVIDLRERMESAAERTRETIRQLRDYRGLRTDAALADRMGMGRTKVNNLAIGATKLTVETVAAFASALEVPDFVLSMQADSALQWVLDNQPNGPHDPDAADLVGTGEGDKRSTKWETTVIAFPLTRTDDAAVAA